MMRSSLRLAALWGLLLVASACGTSPSADPAYDLLILNGSIVDGSGAPAFDADVAIVGDKIVSIGEFDDAGAARVIDASGSVVSPGFIDLHNHADRNIRNNPGAENYLYQGVTTILTGNCGNSPVHLGEYFHSVRETGIALNLGVLIGHNSVRTEVMGNENRAPTADEQAQMDALVKAAMDEGAFGMSTGLIYLPGTYSATGEVVALARVVAAEGGIYASHIRNEFDLIIDAIEEALSIGRDAGLPVHLSHFKVADNTMWGDSTITLGLVESARSEGLDVTIDQYPYTAGSTGLANVLPAWARAGSEKDFQARLDDPETRALLSSLDGVRVRVYEIDGDAGRVAARMDRMSANLQDDGWERVVLVREQAETVHMLLRMTDGRISGMTVLVCDGDREAVVVNLMGDIRPEHFSDVMVALDVDAPGVENVQVADPQGS